jgi:hypothetical protein
MASFMNNLQKTPEIKNVTSFTVNQEYKSFGKYWAAIADSRVVGLVLIPTIADKDKFNSYRDKSREALSIIGEVMTGEIQLRDNTKVFVKRIPRNNNPTENSKRRIEPTYHIPTYLQ